MKIVLRWLRVLLGEYRRGYDAGWADGRQEAIDRYKRDHHSDYQEV